MQYSGVFTLRCDFMPSVLMKGSTPNYHNYRVLHTLAAGSGGALGIKSRLYVTHAILRQCFTLMRRSTLNYHNCRVLITLTAGSGGAFGIKSPLCDTYTKRADNTDPPCYCHNYRVLPIAFVQFIVHLLLCCANIYSEAILQYMAIVLKPLTLRRFPREG